VCVSPVIPIPRDNHSIIFMYHHMSFSRDEHKMWLFILICILLHIYYRCIDIVQIQICEVIDQTMLTHKGGTFSKDVLFGFVFLS
jgi:hypothetical protein